MCYVHLEDVEVGTVRENGFDAIKHSRWFTRGWTLQELVAPASMLFFDAAWNYLGAKAEHLEVLAEITGIPEYVLGRPQTFQWCHLATRLSWAHKRKTSRIEDQAYCLLGLVGINMPLLYGEGSKALPRLLMELFQESGDESLLVTGVDGEIFASELSHFEVLTMVTKDESLPRQSDLRIVNGHIRVGHRYYCETGSSLSINLRVNCKWKDGYSVYWRLWPTGFLGPIPLYSKSRIVTIDPGSVDSLDFTDEERPIAIFVKSPELFLKIDFAPPFRWQLFIIEPVQAVHYVNWEPTSNKAWLLHLEGYRNHHFIAFKITTEQIARPDSETLLIYYNAQTETTELLQYPERLLQPDLRDNPGLSDIDGDPMVQRRLTECRNSLPNAEYRSSICMKLGSYRLQLELKFGESPREIVIELVEII